MWKEPVYKAGEQKTHGIQNQLSVNRPFQQSAEPLDPEVRIAEDAMESSRGITEDMEVREMKVAKMNLANGGLVTNRVHRFICSEESASNFRALEDALAKDRSACCDAPLEEKFNNGHGGSICSKCRTLIDPNHVWTNPATTPCDMEHYPDHECGESCIVREPSPRAAGLLDGPHISNALPGVGVVKITMETIRSAIARLQALEFTFRKRR